MEALGHGDADKVVAAAHLFDGPVDEVATRRFLQDDGHHMLIAWVDEYAAGFVSGVEMTHPDKGTEMFLYELGVDEDFRRRGIGRLLVGRLRDVARAPGCYGMWVATEESNAAALATYEGTGAAIERAQAVLTWTFG